MLRGTTDRELFLKTQFSWIAQDRLGWPAGMETNLP